VDRNSDGTQGTDEEPLPNVTVRVTLSDGSVRTAKTDANGDLVIAGLVEGDASVEIIDGVPSEFTFLTNKVFKVRVLGNQITRTEPFRVVPATGPLAFTGSDSTDLLLYALALAGIGLGTVGLARKRRRQ
jgi:translation initiation factor IF-1